jgi:aspartate/methionine/tyrosine aminotransferase
MFSSRLPPHAEINRLSRAVDALRSAGTPFVDLTESNPTRANLPYPSDLLSPLSDPRALQYDPQPLGARAAREAVAADFARRGVAVDPAHVVLCASTSEAYSWLFKLLCAPGERVLVPRPSYPLFEHLTRLEAVRTATYDLEYHRRWSIDFDTLPDAPADTRALLAVSPNNPTGSYLSASELDRLIAHCRDRRWALIADEVFADYDLDASDPVTDVAARADVLSFTLGGASKTLCLPQVKLGWILVGGVPADRDAALNALEMIADTFLSVGGPIQAAAAPLLERASDIRRAAHARVRSNLRRARELAVAYPSCEVLRVEGGWSAVIRVPAAGSEDDLVLGLLERERILVHPGYFFDFGHGAFIVVSLLVPEMPFADALARVLRFVHC